MPNLFPQLQKEIKYEIMGVILLTIAIFSFISLLHSDGGAVGSFVYRVLTTLFGRVSFLVPTIISFIGLYFLVRKQPIIYTPRFIGIILGIILLMMVAHFPVPFGTEITPDTLKAGRNGGLVGGLLILGMRKAFGMTGTYILTGGLAIIVIALATNSSIMNALLGLKDKAAEGYGAAREVHRRKREQLELRKSTQQQKQVLADEPYSEVCCTVSSKMFTQNPYLQKSSTSEDIPAKPKQDNVINLHQRSEDGNVANDATHNTGVGPQNTFVTYKLPPISLLSKPRTRVTKNGREVSDNAQILQETLKSFGVSVKVLNVTQGPAVTRYELEPAAGVKVSRIVNLSDDIALKLAAPGIRIEAPIPGKAAIGIEVPNKDVAAVFLRDVLETNEFYDSSSKLTVALGKGIDGSVVVTDLAKMPHVLVAGATGSGKSVCINTIILSLLYKARPDEVKLILIDPKMVELSNFNGIPHLVSPVVTDPKKASSALRWAVQEMERRYTLFAQENVRDIKRYNEVLPKSRLPFIVLIIDELADLMMVSPVDVEDAICRLAQMARACGIHLVLATQRPSVDVITGIIKANIPSRIAFAVSSQIDSRTILDGAGAEKLLGKGDMLFNPVGAPKALRVQGAFVPDNEVEQVVEYVKKQCQPQYDESVTNIETAEKTNNTSSGNSDELLEDAIKLVFETGHASTSMIQRRFRVGYTRAARLIDMMEEMKIVGPNIGSKARDILMTQDQVQARYFVQKTTE